MPRSVARVCLTSSAQLPAPESPIIPHSTASPRRTRQIRVGVCAGMFPPMRVVYPYDGDTPLSSVGDHRSMSRGLRDGAGACTTAWCIRKRMGILSHASRAVRRFPWGPCCWRVGYQAVWTEDTSGHPRWPTSPPRRSPC